MGLAEDSKKVERIVAGSYEQFRELYLPRLQVRRGAEQAGACNVDAGSAMICSCANIKQLAQRLGRLLQQLTRCFPAYVPMCCLQQDRFIQLGVQVLEEDRVQQPATPDSRTHLLSTLPTVSTCRQPAGHMCKGQHAACVCCKGMQPCYEVRVCVMHAVRPVVLNQTACLGAGAIHPPWSAVNRLQCTHMCRCCCCCWPTGCAGWHQPGSQATGQLGSTRRYAHPAAAAGCGTRCSTVWSAQAAA
jgi:hypothetical protein